MNNAINLTDDECLLLMYLLGLGTGATADKSTLAVAKALQLATKIQEQVRWARMTR